MLASVSQGPDAWVLFWATVWSDPVAGATLVAAALALLAAVMAAIVSGHGVRVTRKQGERDSGISLYKTAVGWIYDSGSNPDLALQGVQTLTSLLKSKWVSKEFREMANGALLTYTEPRSKKK